MWQYLLIVVVGFIMGVCVGCFYKRRRSPEGIDGVLNLYFPVSQEEPPEMYLNVYKTVPELKDCAFVTFQVRHITDRKS